MKANGIEDVAGIHSVTIVCKYGSLPNEGILTKVYYLAKYLSKSGSRVTLILSDSNHLSSIDDVPKRRDVGGVDVITLKTTKYGASDGYRRVVSWFVFELKVLFELLKLPRQSWYIASSPSLLTGFTAYLITRLRRSRYAFEVRDIWPLTFSEEGQISEKNLFYRALGWVERVSTRNAEYVISSIPRLDVYNANVLKLPRPFLFFPICIDEDLRQNHDGPDYEHAFDGDRLVIGYSGSIGIGNNLDPFIDVIHRLGDDDRFFFKIIGKGSMKDRYLEILRDCTNVEFYDAVSKDQIWKFYRSIDVGYISTHDSELWRYGQSLNKLVEYMSNGLPVIMSYPDHGYKSMINEADCGYFVPPNNPDEVEQALLTLHEMPESQRVAMGTRGAEWVREHRRYESHVDRMIESFKDA